MAIGPSLYLVRLHAASTAVAPLKIADQAHLIAKVTIGPSSASSSVGSTASAASGVLAGAPGGGSSTGRRPEIAAGLLLLLAPCRKNHADVLARAQL
jgi:hypothetical protein